MSFNKLLERQLKKNIFPAEIYNNPVIINFLNQVSESYSSFERDSSLLERSFEITEKEYADLHERLNNSYSKLNSEILKTLTKVEKLTASFAEMTNYDLLFENIKQQIELVSKENAILIYLVDDTENKLKLVYSKGYSLKEQEFVHENAMDFVPGYVFKTGQVSFFSNEQNSIHFNFKTDKHNLSSLFVPIKSKDKIIGVLGIQIGLPESYSKKTFASLKVLASLTGNAYASINKNIQLKQNFLENERLSILAKSTNNILIYCDREGSITWVNKSFEESTGYLLSEIIGKKPGSFLRGENTELEKTAKLRNAIKKREPLSLIITNYKKNGEPYIASIQLDPVFDETGELINFVSIQQDVTNSEKYKLEIELKKTEIEEQKKFYENILNNIPVDIAVFDKQHKYLFLNKEAIKNDELRDFMIGKDDFDYAKFKGISTDSADHRREKFNQAITSKNQTHWLESQKNNAGVIKYKERRFHPYDKFVIGYGVDVTDFKDQELRLSNSLEEKETLLGEVNHRVKNNLALIAGLIELQEKNNTDIKVISNLSEIKNRIITMSLIYEKLYASSNFTQINLKDYIQDLVKNLLKTRNANETIIPHFNMEEIILDLKFAIPIGFIVNELIINSVKYAIKNNNNLNIYTELKILNQKNCLQISDDGPGLSEDIDLLKSKTLGFKLVNIFVRQIKGSIEFKRNPGLTVLIKF